MTTLVIDLSHHNTIPVGLEEAKTSGIVGVIHKLTEGTSYVDSACSARFYLAKEVGMLWGLYHFIRPGNIQGQADFFVNKSASVSDVNTLYCLDYEDAGVSLDDAAEFMERVKNSTGRSPVLYSGHVLKDKLGGSNFPELTEYRLWLAQYGTTYKLPPGWSKYWLWQFTDQGTCPGINPPVDLNDYQNGAQQLKSEWAGTIGSIPTPEPKPEPGQKYTVTITVSSSAPIDIKVNDGGN